MGHGAGRRGHRDPRPVDGGERCRGHGRRLFDTVNGTDGWNEDMGYGADQTGTPPFFVVTHSPPADVRLQRDLGMRVTFVGDLAPAIDRALSAATHGDVVIVGFGDVIGQAIEQGLVRRAAPAPRPDGARWWHAVVQIRDARGVPAARRSCVAQRRAPHLRTGLDATRCDSAPLERRRQEALPLRLQPLTSRPPTTRR